ncbi:MAG: hypothetical protein KDA80_23610 [Planctomycetaceae bacterium]|nr:hypothetical protein [Planctomycetaceae bacterium]
MDVDAALLDGGVLGRASLRFYQWDAPTVSVGHFQATQGQDVPQRFAGLPVVRRLSGGGAILHHLELTYSCVMPKHHPIAKEATSLYDVVHQQIIEELKDCGVDSRMRGADAFAESPFLCFARGDHRDIVIGTHKIVGSAQRRRQGAILQHGSILLSRSPWTPEFPGIAELANCTIDAAKLASALKFRFAEALSLDFQDADFDSQGGATWD